MSHESATRLVVLSDAGHVRPAIVAGLLGKIDEYESAHVKRMDVTDEHRIGDGKRPYALLRSARP